MYTFASCIILFSIVRVSYPWNFTTLGIQNPVIRDVKVVGRRAFIILERTKDSSALLKVSWPDEVTDTLRSKTEYFPSMIYQNPGTCASLLSAVSIDIDRLGRLWVLDRGDQIGCPAKVVLISILSGRIIKRLRISPDEFQNLNITMLLVDQDANLPHAYLGTDTNALFICSVLDKGCHRRNLVSAEQYNLVSLEELHHGSIAASVLAISSLTQTMYITSHSNVGLFSIDLKTTRTPWIEGKTVTNPLELQYVGDKLAPSGLVLSDAGFGYVYTSPRDYAILKWNTGEPIRAESHDVLMQSYDSVSCMTALFYAWGKLWGALSCRPYCNGGCPSESGSQVVPIIKERYSDLQ